MKPEATETTPLLQEINMAPSLDTLPVEVLHYIVTFLAIQDMVRLSMTSNKVSHLISEAKIQLESGKSTTFNAIRSVLIENNPQKLRELRDKSKISDNCLGSILCIGTLLTIFGGFGTLAAALCLPTSVANTVCIAGGAATGGTCTSTAGIGLFSIVKGGFDRNKADAMAVKILKQDTIIRPKTMSLN